MSPQLMDDEHDTQDRTPPPPPRPSGWRRIPVSRTRKEPGDGLHLGGVVSGVSRAYGFDVRTTRIAVVIATLVLPVIALVYLAAWVLLPDSPAEAMPIEDIVRDRRRLPVLIAIGLVIVAGGLGSFGWWFLFHGAPWGFALVAVGVLLWVSTNSKRRDDSSPTPPSSTGATGGAPLPPPEPGTSATAVLPTTAAPRAATVTSRPSRPPREPRPPRRPIGSVAFLLAVVWLGIASLLEATGAWNAPALWVIVTALCIVALGLGISAIVNRSWWLLTPMSVVVWLIVALAVSQPYLDAGTGDRTVTPSTVAAAEKPQRLAAGNLEIDLTELPAATTDDTVDVTAEVGAGRLHVEVPADVTVVLTADVGIGNVLVDQQEIAQGIRQRAERTLEPTAATAAGEPQRTIVLDLRTGLGTVDIDRVD